VLAFIEAAEPRNEIEAALADGLQARRHDGGPEQSRRRGAYGGDRYVSIMASAGARLLSAFAAQVGRCAAFATAVRIRVERVEVFETAQAIIGNINLQRQES
jgi:hypothetical protein